MSATAPSPACSQLPKRRLLLIKFGAIGDIIMTLPAALAMHRAGYQVDWVCGNAVAPLLRFYPWINVLPVDDASLLRGSARQRIRAIFSFWRRFSVTRYDLCATLYYDSRYRVLTLPVRAARKLRLSHTDRATRLIPGRSHSSEYLRILTSAVDGRPDGQTPTQASPVPFPCASVELPADALAGIVPPIDPARPRIILAPAGARNMMRDDILRRWPIEHYVELAAALIERACQVVLAGGPDDQWAAAHFAALPVTDLIGRFSIIQSIALLDTAAVFVSHDTGPLHMAGITRAAIVAIFGPTNPHVFLPRRDNVIGLWGGEGFACRPCYDGRSFAPCTHNGCMSQVTPAMVLAQVDVLLSARREGRALAPRILLPETAAPSLVNLPAASRP